MKTIPRWIIIGGFILSFFAGSINVLSLLSLQHQAVSHLTGSISLIGVKLISKNYDSVIHLAGIVSFFFFGAVLSNLIIRDQVLTFGKRYGVVLLLESSLIFVGYLITSNNSIYSDFFISMACGLQNAMATTFSGAILRTTHMTGIVTDLGILMGSVIRGKKINRIRLQLHIGLLGGFMVGSIFGAVAYAEIGFDAILIPVVFIFLTGFIYTSYRLLKERNQKMVKQ
jgi:uncharacterized membrane protein YoaK (UPF0700 family)